MLSEQHHPTFSDQSLVERLSGNDPKAFEFLYTQYFPAVRQLVQRQNGTEDDAKDVFQDGIIALWNNIREGRYELRQEVKLSSYLIQICKLRWVDRLKKASTRYEARQADFSEPMAEAEAMQQLIGREDRQQFSRQFAQLGERCQEMLKRFYFAKQPLQEIAEALSITEKTAKNEKYRCMQRLKKIVAG